MGEWEVYKIMKNDAKDEFSVELVSKRISCGCRHFRRIEFRHGRPVSGVESSSGCPYHTSSEKSLDATILAISETRCTSSARTAGTGKGVACCSSRQRRREPFLLFSFSGFNF